MDSFSALEEPLELLLNEKEAESGIWPITVPGGGGRSELRRTKEGGHPYWRLSNGRLELLDGFTGSGTM